MKRLILLAILLAPALAKAQQAAPDPNTVLYQAKVAPLQTDIEQAKVAEDCGLRSPEWFMAISEYTLDQDAKITNKIWPNPTGPDINAWSAAMDNGVTGSNDAIYKGEDIAAAGCNSVPDETALKNFDSIAVAQGISTPYTTPDDAKNNDIFRATMTPWLSVVIKARTALKCGIRSAAWYRSIQTEISKQAGMISQNLWGGGAKLPGIPEAVRQFFILVDRQEGIADNSLPSSCTLSLPEINMNSLDEVASEGGWKGN